MHIHVLPAGPIQTNAYLLTAPDLHEAVLIDAPGGIWQEIKPILDREQCRLRELWLTHGHWDHTQGGAEVVQAVGVRVRAHRDDQVLIENPEVMEMFVIPGTRLGPLRIAEFVRQGQHWTALGQTVEVRHVPGHCPGNVLYHFAAQKAAFVGDALFHSGIGRTDLPGGSLEVLERSIREQIFTLPDDTVVYPGHGPETTVEVERETNPFVHA
ncbi:MAG: MBL fold metallo-hydrolase [Opitutaceae bacterium]|nr:MBL fold metallo-hydrolase [Opitutaceae bacterium]